MKLIRLSYIVIFYIWGVLLYNAIGIRFIDELLVVLLCAGVFFHKSLEKTHIPIQGPLLLALIAFFYLGYSVVIGSNIFAGILTDFVIQIKPYLAFFCFRVVKPVYTDTEKKILRKILLVAGVFIYLVGVLSILQSGVGTERYFVFGHPARLATAAIVTALFHFYLSDYTRKEKFIFLFILSAGFLSFRAKFYGFYAFALPFVFMDRFSFLLRNRLRFCVVLLIIVFCVIFVSYGKISTYFLTGNERFAFSESHQIFGLYARPALYVGAFYILMDYFPFGSGLASFATHTSGVFYSRIYYEYGLYRIWGLWRENPNFVSDTFYPCLAQFGVTGVGIFLIFWGRVVRKIYKFRHSANFYFNKERQKTFIIGAMVIVCLAIESVADSTLIQNRGIFLMIIIALVLNKMDDYEKEERVTK